MIINTLTCCYDFGSTTIITLHDIGMIELGQGMDFAGIWEEGGDDCLQGLHDEDIDWNEPGSLARELDEMYGICEEHAQYDDEDIAYESR